MLGPAVGSTQRPLSVFDASYVFRMVCTAFLDCIVRIVSYLCMDVCARLCMCLWGGGGGGGGCMHAYKFLCIHASVHAGKSANTHTDTHTSVPTRIHARIQNMHAGMF
jgi:hypothetical protein